MSRTNNRFTAFKEASLEDAVFVDIETYMTKDYSLRKMSTRAYVEDARFDLLCLAIAQGGDGTVDFYHKFHLRERSLQAARARLALASAEGKRLVCHNASFEALFLKLRWGIEFTHIFDTAAYLRYLGLGASLKNGALFYGLAKADAPPFTDESLRDPVKCNQMARYNATDVALCRHLFRIALEDHRFCKLEVWTIDQTSLLGARGLRVDTQRAKRAAAVFTQHRDEAINALCREFSDFDMDGIRRPKVVLEYVRRRFDVSLSQLDRKASEVVEAKRMDSLLARFLLLRESVISWHGAANRVERMVKGQERVYCPVRYYGAHTGRFSGGGRDADRVNVHNLPKGSMGFEDLELMRGLLAPETGQSWVAADLSAIEARVVAFLAGESELVERFRSGEDVYIWFAERAFPGLRIVKGGENKHLRDLAKQSILGLGFGMGWHTFFAKLQAANNPPDEAVAHRLFDLYQRMFPRIKVLRNRYWAQFRNAATTGLNGDHGHCSFTALVDRSGAGVLVTLPTERRLFYRSIMAIPQMMPWGEIGEQIYYAESYLFDPSDPQRAVRAGQRKKCSDGRYRYAIYGQVLVENIVQAVARDIMVAQMAALEAAGLPVALHVHDEVVVATEACRCPDRDRERGKNEPIEALHRPNCPWIAGRKVVQSVTSNVQTFAKLAGLPVDSEVSSTIRDRYGK